MGNHKFRLSNMIPNAWFFKLKKISTTTNKNNNRSSPKEKSCPSPTLPAPFSSPTSTHKNSSSSDHLAPSSSSSSLSHSRKSYHFTRQLAQQNGNRHHPTSVKSPDSSLSNRPSVDSPRKSIRKSRRSHQSKRRSSTTSRSSTATTNSTATRYCSSSATTGCSCGGSSSTLTSSLQLKPDTCTATSDPNSTLQSSLNSPSHHHPAGDTTNHHTLLQSSSYDRVAAWSSSSTPTFDCDGRSDIVIEVDEKSLSLLEKKTEKAWSGPGVGLPPIKTDYNWKLNGTAAASTREVVVDENKVKSRKSSSKYREKKANGPSRLSVKVAAAEESVASSPATLPGSHRRFSAVGSPGGFRLRLNSPRIARRTTPGRKSVTNSSYSPSGGRGRGRKSISAESLAIVKSSLDPKRDFRDSMVEMIVENNIKASKDLEELLACYLSLNADEYHEVIINVFKQLWFDLNFINGFKARNANNIVNAKTSALKRR